MLRIALAAALAASWATSSAEAAIVLPNNPGGDTFTNGGANNTGQAVGASGWYYNNVRVNGVVGVNGTYPQSGNGSVFMSTPAVASPGTTNGKADIEYFASVTANANGNFSTPTSALGTLGALTALSYDWYRDSTSTNGAVQHPALRLLLSNATGSTFGYIIFERAYNSLSVPTDTWVSDDVFAGDYRMWSTGSLPDPFVTVNARTLGQWISEFPDLFVVGISAGVGSGWGQFTGAVDNITFGFGGSSTTHNFELSATTASTPEPTTVAVWSLLGACVAGLSGRRSRLQAA